MPIEFPSPPDNSIESLRTAFQQIASSVEQEIRQSKAIATQQVARGQIGGGGGGGGSVSPIQGPQGTKGDTGATGATGPAPTGAAGLFVATPSSVSGVASLRAIEISDLPALSFSAGCIQQPTYTDNGDGTCTIGNDGIYALFDNTEGDGIPNRYLISGGVFTPDVGVRSYLVADYNTGSPEIKIITDVDLINETTVIPIITFYSHASELTRLEWDTLGVALPNKLHQSIVKTERFRRQSGLILSEGASRSVLVSEGIIWYGASRESLDAFDSSLDTLRLYAHVSGVWTESDISEYNNSQYDDGTDLASVSANHYVVNWVYRVVCQGCNKVYIILGQGNYKLLEAQASQPPSPLPDEIQATGILVGRIIVESGSVTATQVDSAFSVPFNASTTLLHNDLSGIQDAPNSVAGEHYHLSDSQATEATQYATDSLNGLLTSGDWSTFNQGATDAAAAKEMFEDVDWSTGFKDRTESTISLSTRTLTVAPVTTSFDIYSEGVKFTKTGGATCQTTIAATVGLHFIYFDDAGILQNSMSEWNIVGPNSPVAIVYWNGTAGATADERHGAGRDLRWHKWAHLTIGTRYESGLELTYPTTSTDGAIQVESGYIHDEDIRLSITQQKRCRIWYETAAATWTWVDGTDNGGWDRPYLWNAGTSRLKYPKSNSAYALTDVTNSQYQVLWVYGSNDIDRPIYIIMKSATTPYANLAAARQETTPTTIGVLSPELKLLYRLIYRGDGEFQESSDYRTSSVLPGGGTTIVNASQVVFSPTGDVAATNVQTAIAELDTEKLNHAAVMIRVSLGF